MVIRPAARQLALACIGTASLLAAASAFAHTPYLLPVEFAVSKSFVTLQAAVSEDNYFVPDAGIRNADYYVVNPAGQRNKLETQTNLKDYIALEAALPEPGTYRISTGDQSARTSKMAKIDGQWRAVRAARQQAAMPGSEEKPAAKPAEKPAEKPTDKAAEKPAAKPGEAPRPRAIDEASVPAGAEVIEIQNIQRVETYVTKGAPSEGALKVSGQGFELKPVTHPNEIYLDQGFKFELLNDGQPVKNLGVTVFRGGNAYDDKKIALEARSDANGRVALKFDRPGVYVLTTQYPAANRNEPQTDKPATKRYTYTMTFEVTR